MILSRSDAYKTEYYNDWAKPQGLQPSQVGLKIDIDKSRYLVLGTHVQLRTYDKQAQFYNRSLEKLIPHMNNALQVADLVNTRNQYQILTDSIFDKLNLAVFLLNRKLQLIEANCVAEDILRQDGLLRLNNKTKTLEAILATSSNSLNTAFKKCQNQNNDYPNDLFTLNSAKGPSTYIAWIKTANEGDCRTYDLTPTSEVINKTQDNLILIIAKRTVSNRLSSKILQTFLDLTPAEAKLATALANGVTLKHYANQSAISHNTTRNQLNSIFTKTNISSQTELIGYIWRTLGLAPK